jgi:glycosyltransferase involved in cell wall biosynthesis
MQAEKRPESRQSRALALSRPKPELSRIMVISDAWLPQVNGVVRTYQSLQRQLAVTGCELRVIGPADFPNMAMPSYPEIRLALPLSARLEKMIGTFDPQAIHIPVEGPLGWMARRWCLKNERAFSTAFHTNFPAYVAVRTPRFLRSRAEAMAISVLRRFHEPSNFIYAATPTLDSLLREWRVGNRYERLSRGVDAELFYPDPDRREAPEDPVLLYVGRVAAEKNIAAFLALDVPGQKVVVGDGPQLKSLQRQYPDVSFRGLLVGEPLAAAYRQADVFVFPSKTDTFGNVLLEAIASGLPCAAYDVTGPRDIITSDPMLGAVNTDLSIAVAKALTAPGCRQSRHEFAVKKYSWEKVAGDFLRYSAELQK